VADAVQGGGDAEVSAQSEGRERTLWRANPRLLGAAGAVLVLLAAATAAWSLSEGRVQVQSNPPGAEVFADGRSLGVTPLTLSTHFAASAGAVELRLPGYETQRQSYSIEPGANKTLAVTLAALSGSLEATSEPAGAQVFLDDKAVGSTPLALDRVSPGDHRLRLVLPDYGEWSQQVAVKTGERTALAAQLSALPAQITVTSTPAAATVYLDGKEVGATPLALREVAAGQHALRLAKEGFTDWLKTLQLGPNGSSEVQAALDPAPTPAPAKLPPLQFERPLAVMVDNHPSARPQSGLPAADVVYEALTEGGITRFMAIFATRSVDVVGPVRSARHYFAWWADEYNALYAHCGGYNEAYAAIVTAGVDEVDDLKGHGGFWRSDDRVPPFNLYASTAGLRAAAARLGYETDNGSFGGLTFKDTDTRTQGEAAQRVTLSYPYGYDVVWEYDVAANDYLRFSAGAPHVDMTTGQQLRGNNVVVAFVKNWFMGGDDQQDFQLVGSGRAIYFIDGTVGKGTWSRAALDQPTYFLDAAGQPVALNRGGTTWIQVVPVDANVVYE